MDDIVTLYEEAEELAAQGKLQEAAQKYAAAFERVRGGTSPDDRSRGQLFATRLGNIWIKLNNRREAKPYFDFVGLPTPPVTVESLSLPEAIQVLQQQGLLSELTTSETETILTKLRKKGLHNITGEFLCEYYRNGTKKLRRPNDRAIKDGFVMFGWDFAHQTKNLSAELSWLSHLVGDPLMLRQVSYEDEILTIEAIDGLQWRVKVESVDTIIVQFNRQMQRHGDNRLFAPVEAYSKNPHLLVDESKFRAIFCSDRPALASHYAQTLDSGWSEFQQYQAKWYTSWDY